MSVCLCAVRSFPVCQPAHVDVGSIEIFVLYAGRLCVFAQRWPTCVTGETRPIYTDGTQRSSQSFCVSLTMRPYAACPPSVRPAHRRRGRGGAAKCSAALVGIRTYTIEFFPLSRPSADRINLSVCLRVFRPVSNRFAHSPHSRASIVRTAIIVSQSPHTNTTHVTSYHTTSQHIRRSETHSTKVSHIHPHLRTTLAASVSQSAGT